METAAVLKVLNKSGINLEYVDMLEGLSSGRIFKVTLFDDRCRTKSEGVFVKTTKFSQSIYCSENLRYSVQGPG